MKKIIVVITVLISFSLYGAFEDTGKDIRARGMGNAFYSEPGGVSSIHYNPAGTAFTKKIEVEGYFGLPYLGYSALNMNRFEGALIIPLTYHFYYEKIFKNMNFGVSFNNFSLFYENSSAYNDDNLNYYERLLTFNLSKDLLELLGPGTRLSVGANFNIYFRGLQSNIDTEAMMSYLVNGLGTSGFGLDAGALLFLNTSMIIGVVFDNIIPPNVSFNKELGSEFIKMHTKLGFSWKQRRLWKFQYVTVSGGVAFYNLKSNDWEYHLGFEEWEFHKMFGWRVGYELSDFGLNDLSLGLSWKKTFKAVHEVEVDYAFSMPVSTLSGTFGTHAFSVKYLFTMPKYLFEYKPSTRYKMMNGEKIDASNTNQQAESQKSVKKKLTKEEKAAEKKRRKEEAKKRKAELKKQKAEAKKKALEAKNREKTPSVKPAENKIESKAVPAEDKIHVIVSGDNLYGISKKYYGTSKYWRKIAEYNGLQPPNYAIKLGMKLKIPDVEKLK